MDDARLKKNARPIRDPLARLEMIRGVEYECDASRYGFSETETHVGVDAQDVEAAGIPGAVVLAPFDVDRRGGGGSASGKHYMMVRYDKLVPLLIEAVKELTCNIGALQCTVNELKGTIDELKGTVGALQCTIAANDSSK
jgi:hypothetical protein